MLDDDIHAVAKETMGEEMESADLGEARELSTYGNKEGLDLLRDVHEMKEMMKRFQNEMLQLVDHKAQIDRLQYRVDILSTDAEKYHGIRHR